MLLPFAKTVKLFPQNPRSTCAFELQMGKHLRFFLPCPRLFLKYWVRNLLTKVSSTYSLSLAIVPRVVTSCIIKISAELLLGEERMRCLFSHFSHFPLAQDYSASIVCCNVERNASAGCSWEKGLSTLRLRVRSNDGASV